MRKLLDFEMKFRDAAKATIKSSLFFLSLLFCFSLSAQTDSLEAINAYADSLSYQEVIESASSDVDASTIKPLSGFSFTSLFRGILGMLTLLLLAFLFSENRKAINWGLVSKGLLMQIIFALLVLKVPFVEGFFETVSKFFVQIISFTNAGTEFLFESFITQKIEPGLVNFVVQVLPTIIFFSALTSLLYYWGILQKFVFGFAWIMKRLMKLSGAESLAAAGNIFLGQTEAPLLVKPYLPTMTRSELLCLMSGGMATIAGGVLAAYIGFLGGGDEVEQIYFAKHLLAASVMSAPAAVIAAKILVPETEEINQSMEINQEKIGGNALEAITNGTTEGIRLAVNVGAMLLVFIAFITMGNFILNDIIGHYTGINNWVVEHTNFDGLSFEFLIGYSFAPVAWLMGVAKEDMVLVGQLLGEKTILNEFVAYVSLGEMKAADAFAEQKSITMATYILCGFANFASIGIQIGGIGALAPSRKSLLSKYGVKALIGGTLASLFTAVIVGVLL
ncbi:MAG: nucleoside transporter C-terminal domain-containing protein [Vicingaceae bacterium]